MNINLVKVWQTDCLNCSYTSKDLTSFIIGFPKGLIADEYIKIFAYIKSENPNHPISYLKSSSGNLEVISKYSDCLEVEYIMKITEGWQLIKELGGYVIPPVIVTPYEEIWVVLLPELGSRKKIISTCDELEYTIIQDEIPLDIETLGALFKNIDMILDLLVTVKSLTYKQTRILKEAYSLGYYDINKKIKLANMAENEGVSKATISRRLQQAEHKILKPLIKIVIENTPSSDANGFKRAYKKGQKLISSCLKK